MRHIKVVADSFAVMDDDKVIGTISKTNETQWGFFPISGVGELNYVQLKYAIQAAMQHQPS